MRAFARLTVALLVVIGLGVAIEARNQHTKGHVPAQALGQFAGYSWHGTPHSISADWRVPEISAGSEAHSSTWIGVQSPSSAFIQLGIIEDEFGPLAPIYQGFWSDDTVEFHPQPVDLGNRDLAPILAGDLISVSISEAPGGWHLHLYDAHNRLAFDETIPMTTTGFDEGEWTQEDPTDGFTLQPLPYPSLSPVRFMDLRINGNSPTLDLDDASWMSLPGTALAPTALARDSFGIVPVRFDDAQAEFLTASTPYHVAATRFDDTQSTWRAHPPLAPQAVAALQPFLVATSEYDRTLSSRSWKLLSKTDIGELVKFDRLDATALLALAQSEPDPNASVVANLASARAGKKTANQRIDNKLGLP